MTLSETIISLVPDILELGVGTRVNIWWCDTPFDRLADPDEENVLVFGDRSGWRDNGEWKGKYRSCIEDNTTGYYEILGRPITLADVLRAMSKKGKPCYVYSSGQVYRKGGEYLGNWNHATDLDGQSEPTKAFLRTLLGANEG